MYHIIHLYQDMNIVHFLYIRVFHLYFIIIFNFVILFLMSNTAVKN